MPTSKYLIVIAGPTAVGKTQLTLQLAKYYNATIFGADSRQFYKELAIGTAKPTPEELAFAPHKFVDFISIHQSYNVGMYANAIQEALAHYFEQHDVAILSGGSGLYIDAALKGINEMPEIPDSVRAALKKEFEEKGLVFLQQEVQELDPEFYAEVDQQNPVRLMRALEVIRVSGKKFSAWRMGPPEKEKNYNTIKIVLNRDREELYNRINQRVDKMLHDGLLKEVESVYEFKQLQALQTVGYRELFSFFDGEINFQEAVDLIKQNTRRYAKRQVTWFKKDPEYHWIDASESFKTVLNYIQSIRTSN